MMAAPPFTPLVNFSSDRSCFGCGERNPHGLKMTFSSNGQRVVSTATVPEHLCGWSGLVHGGVIATLLDEIMSWAAIQLLHRLILTKSMQLDFLRPVRTGEPLRLEAWIEAHSGPNEAEVAGVLFHNETGKCCARSRGQFALFTADSKLINRIFDAKTVAEFEVFYKTYESKGP
jgi:uncharacterized protein (TIGR00369 family)